MVTPAEPHGNVIAAGPAFTIVCEPLELTRTVWLAIHPFNGFVAVTVYVPADVTMVVSFVGVVPAGTPEPGPVQEKVAPFVVELAVIGTDVTEQDNNGLAPTLN